jgi:hypothetical protein
MAAKLLPFYEVEKIFKRIKIAPKKTNIISTFMTLN